MLTVARLFGMPVTDQVTVGSAPPAVAEPEVSCTHCGLPVPDALYDPAAESQFCCAGCRTANELIVSGALHGYYRLPERRGVAVAPQKSSFEEYDHEAFGTLHVRTTEGGMQRVQFLLQGVHCGSCVWLVERVPLLLTGVARVELDLRRALATVEWDQSAIALSEIARTLDTLGYTPYPFRGSDREALRRVEDRRALMRIAAAGALAINVMLASLALYAGWLGDMDSEWESYFRWVALLLVTPAVLWPGRVFFTGARAALRARTLNMDVPIAIGLGAGYLHGSWNTITGRGPIYFDGLAVLIFALLAGRYLQTRGQRAAHDSADLLRSITPATARVIGEDGTVSVVPTAALLPGALVRVRSGEVIPADGIVTTGESGVDNALLTGESRPEPIAVGSRVWGGTLNVRAAVTVRVTASGEETRAAGLMRQVEESAARKAPVVLTANRLAGTFVAVVLVLALVTAVAWMFVDPSQALDNAIALLIVTCPCALALATPLAVSVAIGKGARAGILVKGGDVLESLATPGVLLLDKTGTITEGASRVVGWEGGEWLRGAVVALEGHSSHPIAGAILASWNDLPPVEASAVRQHPGAGIEGVVEGRHVRVGSARFALAAGTNAPWENGAESVGTDDSSVAAHTVVFVSVDGESAGRAWIGDSIRSDSRDAIATLNRRGWESWILSGDAPQVVSRVAEEVGVPRHRAIGGLSPEEKLAKVRELSPRGTVVMVGDGINDAAAMAAATVGVGVHGGAEVCLETADAYLSRPGLAPLVALVEGGRRTMGAIRRNIVFALVYNVIGAGMAMAGVLSPLAAAILMPASSLTVVFASWRARTFGPAEHSDSLPATSAGGGA